MALSRLNYNSLNVTPTADKGIGFDAGADDLAATFSGGNMVFIKKLTASTSSTLSFVDGASSVVLDNTYKEYIFTFKSIHVSDDSAEFTFNGSIDTGSNYNVAKTSSFFDAEFLEDGTYPSIGYQAGEDLAQGTGFQTLAKDLEATDNDAALGGYLHLFNPSSTTFVKHFLAKTAAMHESARSYNNYIGGYFNTTSAVDAVQFKMSAGTIDAGDICLYGIK